MAETLLLSIVSNRAYSPPSSSLSSLSSSPSPFVSSSAASTAVTTTRLSPHLPPIPSDSPLTESLPKQNDPLYSTRFLFSNSPPSLADQPPLTPATAPFVYRISNLRISFVSYLSVATPFTRIVSIPGSRLIKRVRFVALLCSLPIPI
ncbi:hypothetical protein Bca52824_077983 [Brassica carinata]|uniref:Uncharacterized protein n=1 Tax=Brassica carinata TaxID=52824 RepID=A0A8X7TYQ3_BRACI|nr:hypothetical protein Bca52824_077983 [Brassica carinata]